MTEEEKRRKEIIDGGGEVAGLMVCLSGSAALTLSSAFLDDEKALRRWQKARTQFVEETQRLLAEIAPREVEERRFSGTGVFDEDGTLTEVTVNEEEG